MHLKWYKVKKCDKQFHLILYTAPKHALNSGCLTLVPTPYEIHGNNQGWDCLNPSIGHIPEIAYAGNLDANKQRRIAHRISQNVSWLQVFTNYVSTDKLRNYKYVMDIGGYSGTTWTALRMKMSCGLIVFKVEHTNVDWWHDRLADKITHVSISHDFSNLEHAFRWAESSTNLSAISTSAIQVARQYTWRNYCD